MLLRGLAVELGSFGKDPSRRLGGCRPGWPVAAQAASVSGRAVSRRRSVSAGRTLHLTLLPSTPLTGVLS